MSVNASVMIYEYTPLPITGRTIRLLSLLPGISSSPLRCHLEAVSLDTNPPYEALSYTWGSPLNSLPITILPSSSTSSTPSTLSITQSLSTALHHFRLQNSTRILWADAICIDQSSPEERSRQVLLMRDIYSQALSVVIWLGPASFLSPHAMKLIREGGRTIELSPERNNLIDQFLHTSVRTLEEVLQRLPTKYSLEWEALKDLLKRPYFQRMWIIQEVAVARTAKLHCGNDVVSWDHLYYLVLFALKEQFIMSAEASHFSSVPSLTVVQDAVKLGQRKPLLSLLLQVPTFKATDARDKIYALLGLAEEGMRIDVDYRAEVPNVYKRSVIRMIQHDGNLDILNFPPGKGKGTGEEGNNGAFQCRLHRLEDTLPSWVPDFESRTQRIQPLTLQDFNTGNHDTPKFHACGKGNLRYMPPNISGSEVQMDKIDELELQGCKIDIIVALGADSNPLRIPTDYFDGLELQCEQHTKIIDWERTAQLKTHGTKTYKHTTPEDNETLEDAYFQTLQGGYLPYGKRYHKQVYEDFKSDFETARRLHEHNITCVHAMLAWCLIVFIYNRSQARTLPYFSDIFDPEIIGQERNSQGLDNPSKRFFTHCKAVVNRRLMRTRDGYIGLAPKGARVGDEVWVVKGAKTPLVLRRKMHNGQDGSWKWSGKHRLQGDAYVHGLMFGKGWEASEWKMVRLI